MAKQFKHKNLLRNDQVKEAKGELARMEHMLKQPHLQDRNEMMRQKRSVETMLHDGEAVPFSSHDIDAAKARESELREQITRDMPTTAEMRHAPPGIVGRHRQWERANKQKIKEWKYIRRRMFAGSDDPDVSNIERFRPRHGAPQEGNLDGGIVERQADIFVPLDAVHAVTASDEQLSVLEQIDPNLAERIGLLDAEQRRAILDVVDRQLNSDPEVVEVDLTEPESGRGKHMSKMSEEDRKALGQRLAAARKAKKEEREAQAEAERLAEAAAN